MSTASIDPSLVREITASCVQMILRCRLKGKTQATVRQAIAPNNGGFLLMSRQLQLRTNEPGLVQLYLSMFASVNEQID